MEPPRDWHRQINKGPNGVIGTFRLPIVNLRHNKVETLKAEKSSQVFDREGASVAKGNSGSLILFKITLSDKTWKNSIKIYQSVLLYMT